MNALDGFARRAVWKSLESLTGGSLVLIAGGRSMVFGDSSGPLRAVVTVHRERFFRRVAFGGDVAAGEAWMDGDWSSPDLVAVVRLAVRNLARIDGRSRWLTGLRRAADIVRHRLRRNSLDGSRRNIREHYDLSNEFFRLFLDCRMMYSCAFYETAGDSLETAQVQKVERICRKLQLAARDHVLEIGTGWGGFAEYAVRNYGCRVTTTTISDEQHAAARQRFARIPEGARIELLRQDYRRLQGQYDKIVSIEMFEAVGLRYYDTFFRACERLLRPGGAMLLQTITLNEQSFPEYRRSTDWIQRHIFPGSELASVSEILRSLARATSLGVYHAEDIGAHYARTLAAWRQRFHESLPEVRRLGFGDRFVRMWDYYLGYCEGAFLERHTGDFQLLLAGRHRAGPLFEEPWLEERERAAEVAQ